MNNLEEVAKKKHVFNGSPLCIPSMTNDESFDKETLRSNAGYINDSLLSRGYTQRRVLLLSTDQNELSPDPIELTAEMFSNDINIIDTLLHLFNTVTRTKEQLKQASAAISTKDDQVARLTARALSAERKADIAVAKLESSVSVDSLKAQDSIRNMTRTVKSQAIEISRLKNVCGEYTLKYEIEMKRKCLEIDNLLNRLTDTRLPSSAVTFGIPITEEPYARQLTPNLIYGNHGILKQNSQLELNDHGKAFIDRAIAQEEISVSSAQRSIINELTIENRKISLVLQRIGEYFESANSTMSNLQILDMAAYDLPDPQTILMDPTENDHNATVPFEVFCNQVKGVDEILDPVVSNINQFYHNMSMLLDHFELGHEDGQRTKELEDQLEKILKSCEDAWRTVEDWKRYYEIEHNNGDGNKQKKAKN